MQESSDEFGSVVTSLKQQYNIQHVLCWHAMAGYWSGIMPDAHEMRKYGAKVMYPRPSSGTLEVDASMRWYVYKCLF